MVMDRLLSTLVKHIVNVVMHYLATILSYGKVAGVDVDNVSMIVSELGDVPDADISIVSRHSTESRLEHG